jgi:hypothetical protein
MPHPDGQNQQKLVNQEEKKLVGPARLADAAEPAQTQRSIHRSEPALMLRAPISMLIVGY